MLVGVGTSALAPRGGDSAPVSAKAWTGQAPALNPDFTASRQALLCKVQTRRLHLAGVVPPPPKPPGHVSAITGSFP